jgi:hypothetical protein
MSLSLSIVMNEQVNGSMDTVVISLLGSYCSHVLVWGAKL